MKNDARVGALAFWSEQSRYYVCFVNETLNNSGEPLTGGFTLGCLLSCVVCGSLRGTCCHFRLTCLFIRVDDHHKVPSAAPPKLCWWVYGGKKWNHLGGSPKTLNCVSSCATVSVGTIVSSKSSQLLKGLTLGFHTACCWVWKSVFRLTGDTCIRRGPVIQRNEHFPLAWTVHSALVTNLRTCMNTTLSLNISGTISSKVNASWCSCCTSVHDCTCVCTLWTSFLFHWSKSTTQSFYSF